jgi:hypothetical protein
VIFVDSNVSMSLVGASPSVDSIPEIELFTDGWFRLESSAKAFRGARIPTFRQCQDLPRSGAPESPLPLNPMPDRDKAFPMGRLVRPARFGCIRRR